MGFGVHLIMDSMSEHNDTSGNPSPLQDLRLFLIPGDQI